ncbi:MAG TPA: GH25 family lysozyme [Xanthobacteraceae bacterium]|nr:GH25 family lysozyme [Xanthobacteraceae bacterium]
MHRAVQPGLMVLAAAVLVIAAVLIPVVILWPTSPAFKPPPTADAPARTPPFAETDSEGDLSRAQRFRLVEQETLKRLGPGALISALPRAFVFPHSRNDAIFGIDVSHHNQRNCQCDIDWARVAKQKVAFVVAKATEGVRFRDPHFRGHWEEIARVPEIYRGAYHFLSADDDPVEQANYFLATMGPLRAVDMPPVLDLEWDVVVRSTRKWAKRDGDYWSQLTPNEIIDRVLQWLDVVEKRTGRIPMVYTSRAWWDGRIKSDAMLVRLKRYPIWLSAMEEKDLQVERPGTRGGWAARWNWTLWQFTNRGDLTKAGIPNPPNPRLEGFDVNLFRGSVADFRKAMGIETPIVIAETETKPAIGTSAAAQEATPTEPATETGKPDREQPKEAAKEPSKETPKSESEVAVVPSDAAKPTEAVSPGTTPESASTGAAAEPPKIAANEPPPEPPKQAAKDQVPEAPKEAAKEPTPEPPKAAPKAETEVAVIPSDATKPTESGGTSAPSQPGGTGAAAEPSKEATIESAAATPKEATKQPVPEVPKEEAKEPMTVPHPVIPKAETEVAAVPGSESGSKPDSSQGNKVVPPTPPAATEPKEEPSKETQLAGIPTTGAGRGGAGAAAANVQNANSAPSSVPTTDAATALPRSGGSLSPSIIEIVLPNGRVLRVHAEIDPQVLMRFIALLEK